MAVQESDGVEGPCHGTQPSRGRVPRCDGPPADRAVLDARRRPAEALGYLAAILTALLMGMLVLRPTLFALAGLWLVGIAGSGLYFLRYLPPALALGLGSVLSTLACSVGLPLYRRALGLVFRRHV